MKKKTKLKFKDAGSKPQIKKMNPFEIHTNRKKFDVLGMKSKTERGLPGISRTRSLKKVSSFVNNNKFFNVFLLSILI